MALYDWEDDVVITPMPAEQKPAGGGVVEAISGFLGGPIGAAVGSIGSGLFSRRSDKKARQYQEALDNSRYQRAAADMEKAGLNRILALGSPATSFSGGSGSMPDVGQAGVAGAEQQRKRKLVNSELGLLNTQQEKMVSEMNFNSAMTAKAWADKDLSESQRGFTNQQKEESAAREELFNLQQASAKAESDFWKDVSKEGKFAQFLMQLLSGGAKSLVR